MQETREFYGFDQYITGKMLKIEKADQRHFTEEERYLAYRLFLQRTRKNRMAATLTIKKWFGLNGTKRPNREMLFQLGFLFGHSLEEQRIMLVEGALEPDFQVNDYREMIFLYGFYQQMTYEDCLQMIREFEDKFPRDFTLNQHNFTCNMWAAYGCNCDLPKQEFLEWMLKHAEDFKGYSQTVLSYFKNIKTEILKEIKSDALRRLDELLSETGFEKWNAKWGIRSESRLRAVARYLKSNQCENADFVSQELKMAIMELLEIGKKSVDSNTDLLAELYTDLYQKIHSDKKRYSRRQIHLMDDKYLSDLLNIATQKEKLMRLIVRDDPDPDRKTYEIREQQRRCVLLGRQDILPLILCVSQKRYMRRLEKENYDMREAKQVFVDLAEQILAACQMAGFDEDKYELDHLLGSCYRPDEMYSLADVLEIYFGENAQI